MARFSVGPVWEFIRGIVAKSGRFVKGYFSTSLCLTSSLRSRRTILDLI